MTIFAWATIAVLIIYLVSEAVIFLIWRAKAYK
jgi:hypothetical protein